ncbi:MAG: HAMP domain-containing histidine kinase [Bacteroidetes bacterium]|nr:HAMP domain-containing histidine kinase [Bacteroidota bacterium]MCW5896470.1 HAMP domain-containing histidine kinase [Bacteroidota bacterium]
MRTPYSPAAISVGAALLLIVPLLAYLQYVWLGQLSTQERERMQSNLRSTAWVFAMEFNREMTGLLKAVGAKPERRGEQALSEVALRLQDWKARTPHPRIVRDCSLADSPGAEHATPIRIDDTSTVLFFNNGDGFAVPLRDDPQRSVIVHLDLAFVRDSLLPEYMRTFFSATSESEFEIAIFDRERKLFFSSTKDVPPDILDKADAVASFLAFPPIPLSMVGTGRMPPPPQHDDRRMRPESNIRDGNPLQRFGPDRGNSPPKRKEVAFFELRARHQRGSLEAAVNHIRLRNLGISFGVLLLLGASVVFLLISSHKAHQLAQQQLEFVAGISHELRTPLAVLKSAGENLADGVIHDPGRAQQYGEVIKNEVERLGEMINQALDYGGIQSGKRTYDLHPLDIAAVLEEVLYAVRHKTADDIAIDTYIPPDLPQVLGDTSALQSAFENLLTNALKYSGETKWVGLEAEATAQNGRRYINIIVRDKGIGIPSSDVDDIFEPFHRARNAMDAQIPGSGLGLSITKHIVEGHGGTITATSSMEIGTVFTVRIPTHDQNGTTT